MGNYYAFIAHNCVAVFSSWSMVEKSKKYAVKPYFKKFSTFYEAEAHALKSFAEHYPVGYTPIGRLECNQIEFTKNHRPENVMCAAIDTQNHSQIAFVDDCISSPVPIDDKMSANSLVETEFDDGKYYIEINL